MHIFMEMFREWREWTRIDDWRRERQIVGRGAWLRKIRDERIRKIQYNVSLCSFFFFFFFFVPTFDSRLKERVRLSLTKFYIDISAVRKFSRGTSS